MSLVIHLRVIGLILVVLGVAHALFPRRFSWKDELQNVSLLTRQVFYVHHFFVALVVGMLGILCLFWSDALLQPTSLGRVFLGGVTIFWLCRLLIQFFIFDAKLWRSDAFNMRVHIVLALLWFYLTITFGAACLRQWQ